MKKYFGSIMVLGVLLLVASPVFTADKKKPDTLAKELLQCFEKGLKALTDENLADYMSTVHTSSMSYPSTKNAIQGLLKRYDLKYAIVSQKFIGFDGEYAYMRVTQTTTKIAGPAFRNNKLDALHVFKKENGQWKLWQTAILSVAYLK